MQLLPRKRVEARKIIQAWALDNEAVAALDSNDRIQLLTRGGRACPA